MGLISLRPMALRTDRSADSAALSVGSGMAATCIVAAIIGIPVLVVLGIIALVIRPGSAVMGVAWEVLLAVAICWAVGLVAGLALTAIGRRQARDRFR